MRFQMSRGYLVGALALGCSFSCSKSETKPAPPAQLGEAVAVKELSASATASKYSFSAGESKIGFVGAKLTSTQSGSFSEFSGTITVDPAAVAGGSVTVEIHMDSLTTDNAQLSAHLKSPDFFDVAKFPSAQFTSTAVVAGGNDGATHTITGNLNLHGITKSISFPAKIQATADGVSVDASFAIDRQAFAVTYPGMPDDLIKDELGIQLQIRAKKAG